MGAKGKARANARARVKPDIDTTAESKGISPYKWANNIDEEDEQVSSWERRKGRKLASLETLDDEGERCRPRRNIIATSSRKVDPRRVIRYLAEDDEGEQASG